MKPGVTYIYLLFDPRGKHKGYMGKSNRPNFRYNEHLWDKKVTYKQRWIQKLKSLGLKPSLIFLEEVLFSKWQEREQYWIKYYRETLNWELVNGTDGGEGGVGRVASEETKRKQSKRRRGWVPSEETRAKWREQRKGKGHPSTMKGKTRSSEFCEKQRELSTQRWADPNYKSKTIASLKASWDNEYRREAMRTRLIGYKVSEETRMKLSKANTGKRHSVETRDKIKAARRLQAPMSEEQKQQVSLLHKGRRRSEETKRKMSEAASKRWARSKSLIEESVLD